MSKASAIQLACGFVGFVLFTIWSCTTLMVVTRWIQFRGHEYASAALTFPITLWVFVTLLAFPGILLAVGVGIGSKRWKSNNR